METMMYGAGLLGFLLGLPFLAFALGKINKFWSIVEEGTARIFLRSGKYKKTVANYEGFHLRPPKREEIVHKDENGANDPWWHKYIGGLRWIGLWPFDDVYNYNFRWQTLERTVDENGKAIKKVVNHEKKLDYVFLKASTYYAKLPSTPIEGNFIVDIGLILVLRVINPREALFRSHQWYEFAVDNILPGVREFSSNKTFDELKEEGQLKSGALYEFLETTELTAEQEKRVKEDLEADGKSPKEIEKEIKERRYGVTGILRKIYGIDVMSVKIDDIDSSDERYKIALSKAEEAKLEAQRINTINAALAKYGEQAELVRYLEAIEKTSEGTGNTIIPLGLQALLGELSKKMARKENKK